MTPASASEVDEVAAIGGEVAAPFRDAAPKPLAEFEVVRFPIPADGADGVRRPSPEHDAHPRLGREQNMQPGWKLACHFP